MSTLKDWDNVTPAAEISVDMIDSAIKEMKELREVYDSKKKESNEAYEAYEEAKEKVLSILKAAKKTKYHVDGVGTAYTTKKYIVSTPKTNEDKKKLFEYIKEKHGPDTLMGMVSINHQTLNSFYNSEAEANETKGKDFALPGIAPAVAEESVGFRNE